MKNKTFLSIFLFFLFSVASAWAEVEEYSIYYKTNGGSLADSAENPQPYTVEDAFELPRPNRKHYIFVGWFDKEDKDGKRISEIAKGSTGNITLYARWTPFEYKITYELNGGELPNNVPNPQVYTFESDDIDLPKPFKIGYKFVGWFDEYGNDVKMKIYSHSSGDLTLFAKWEEQPPTNLSALEGNYTVQNGEVLTGKLAGNYKISIAEGAIVTLNGVSINGVNDENCKWAGITCEGNCNIILAENSTNSVKGFYDEYPGIYVPAGKTLTILGTGSLEASSNGFAAGIGSGYNGTAGNISISGGTITATGGKYAAGIGGSTGAVGDISISGGSVTAMGGEYATGIGGGNNGTVGDISISGGTVTATRGGYSFAAGIGGGNNGIVGNITISGGTVTAEGGYYAAGIGGGNIGIVGNITISGDETKIVATKIGSESYSIGKGNDGSRTGAITIGGVETSDIVTDPFEYPYLMLVHEDGDGKHAIFNGEYKGDASVKISKAIDVNSITLNRTFSANTPSTVVLPFELPKGATFNAEFYGLNDVAQVGYAWKATMKYIGDGVLPNANTPYVVVLPKDGQLKFNLNGATAKMHTNDIDTTRNKDETWYFTGVYQYKTWGGEDDDELGLAYAFSGRNEDKVAKGKFGKIVAGGYAYPLRAYLRKTNADVVLKQSQGCPLAPGEQRAASAASLYSVEFLPETIEVELVKDDENGNEHTTFVGRMNTRTGEIQIIRDGRTFDLKGRHVGKPKAKGIYLKK